MRRWLLGGLVAVAGALGVAWIALANASRWIDANRAWIGAQVAGAVGRPVSFGAVGVALFPRLGVRVADVRVGDDPAWSSDPFVTATAADVQIALLPALAGRLVVRRVALDAPVVTVIRGPAGRNVDSLFGGPAPAATSGRRVRAPRPSDRGGAGTDAAAGTRRPLPVAVDAGSVRDGRVRLVDRRGREARVVELVGIHATVRGLRSDRPARIDGRAAIAGAPGQEVRVTGAVGPLDLAALERTPVDASLRAAAIDVGRLRAALPEVAETLPAPLGLEGPLDVTVRVTGTASAPAFETHIDATRARVSWAEWFAKPAGVALGVDAAGRREGRGAHLDQFQLALAELALRGRGDASPAQVAVRVDVPATPLAPLARLIVPAASWQVDGRLALGLDVEGPVTAGRTPALTGTVVLDAVRVRSVDPRFELAGLTQTIAFEGDTAVLPATAVRVNGVPMVVGGRLGRFGSPVVALSDLDVRVFDGRVQGRLEADRRAADRPRLAADLRLADIDVAAAAATQAPGAARAVAGRLSGTVTLAGRGATTAALRESLEGQGRLQIADGTLRGVNLADRVLAGVTRVPGLSALIPARIRRKYPAVFGGEETRFDELSATWRIADRVVRLDRVAVAARDYAIVGRGTLGMNGALDATGELELAPALTDDLVGAAGAARVLRNARGRLAIPFAVTGTWPRVRVTPDVGRLGAGLPGEAIERGVGRLLDGLFKRR